jgi:hypothetical protein
VYPEITVKTPKNPVIPMTLTNTTRKPNQRRTERSEVHSRPKGVNPQDHSRTNLNQKLSRIHQRTRSHPKVLQEYLKDQWENNFQPQWFITLLWNDLPTHFDTVEGHSKTFRNIFLTQLMGCNSPTKIPDPPERPSLVFMHERKPVIRHGRQILAFHTHLHLGALPDPLNHLWFIDLLIHQKVAPRVQKLLKTTTEGNRGVVIKPWVWDHHAFYNLKDYYSYKHHQDADLVLDYINSDWNFPTE